MKPKGIVIIGTHKAGKQDVVKELVNRNNLYSFVAYVPVTGNESKYFVTKSVDNQRMGILLRDLRSLQGKGNIPVIIVPISEYKQLSDSDEKFFIEYLSFFIDAPDEVLNERISIGTNKVSKEDIIEREQNRKVSDLPNYIIQNLDSNRAAELIDRLVSLSGCGTVLSEKDIELYIANGLLVSDAEKKQIKGASYDLRLGDEYYYRGEIIKLEKGNQRLTIAPYDYAIVASKETICLPKDVVAHFGLTVTLFCQGLILSNGQQVDPGFRGTLFCLLFNTSNQPVTIKRGDHYATIDFAKMDSFASKYKGKYQEKRDIIDVIPANAMQGGLSELKKEIEELKHESHSLQSIYISVISIIVAAISILLILK